MNVYVFLLVLLSVTPCLSWKSRGCLKKDTEFKPKDCMEAKSASPESGVVTIYPPALSAPLQVYCDHNTDGGGWVVFQRRQDGSVDFSRTWDDYERGFGDVAGEFWLGLATLRSLTAADAYTLRVDLAKAEGDEAPAGAWNGTEGYATYSNFSVGDIDSKYMLSFGDYTGGNVGDSLTYHKGQQWSTIDRDNDKLFAVNCAQDEGGAWWHSTCKYSSLNGLYRPSRASDGIIWNTWLGNVYSLEFAEMKIRAE